MAGAGWRATAPQLAEGRYLRSRGTCPAPNSQGSGLTRPSRLLWEKRTGSRETQVLVPALLSHRPLLSPSLPLFEMGVRKLFMEALGREQGNVVPGTGSVSFTSVLGHGNFPITSPSRCQLQPQRRDMLGTGLSQQLGALTLLTSQPLLWAIY